MYVYIGSCGTSDKLDKIKNSNLNASRLDYHKHATLKGKDREILFQMAILRFDTFLV